MAYPSQGPPPDIPTYPSAPPTTTAPLATGYPQYGPGAPGSAYPPQQQPPNMAGYPPGGYSYPPPPHGGGVGYPPPPVSQGYPLAQPGYPPPQGYPPDYSHQQVCMLTAQS